MSRIREELQQVVAIRQELQNALFLAWSTSSADRGALIESLEETLESVDSNVLRLEQALAEEDAEALIDSMSGDLATADLDALELGVAG